MEASTYADNAASCSPVGEASSQLQEAWDAIQSKPVVVNDVKSTFCFPFLQILPVSKIKKASYHSSVRVLDPSVPQLVQVQMFGVLN